MKRLAALLTLLLLVGACDSGPQGPGDLTGAFRTSGPPMGGVVFEVIGGGIEKFTGTGGTKVFWAAQADPNTFRVILVGAGGGELPFTVTVTDRSRNVPRATVLSVVDPDNRPVPVTKDHKVKISK